MPKFTSINTRGPLVKFAIKSVLLTAIAVVLISLIISFVVFKADLDIKLLEYFSYAAVCISAAFISFFSVKPLKNNGFVLGMLSSVPLIIFSFVNLIVHGNNIIHFLIKLVLILIISGIFGFLSASKAKKFKVK